MCPPVAERTQAKCRTWGRKRILSLGCDPPARPVPIIGGYRCLPLKSAQHDAPVMIDLGASFALWHIKHTPPIPILRESPRSTILRSGRVGDNPAEICVIAGHGLISL